MGIPIPEFKVLLYGPSFHAAGIRARAHFDGESLAISAHNGSFLVPSHLITLRTGGFDGRQWLITWVAQEGTYSAMLQNEAALRAFVLLAPASIGRQLQRIRGGRARNGRLRRFALLLLALLPLLGVGLYTFQADRLKQWAATRIDLERERQLGDMAYAQIQPALKPLDRGVTTAAVENIGNRLTAESYYHYHFHVVVDPGINAYALPGGHIVVNTGLIEATNSAGEFAGVLAHEISHVEQRHTLRKLVTALDWRAVLGVALGNYSSGLWIDMAERLGHVAYSPAQESEADLDGLDILRRAEIAPNGMETFFARMAAKTDATRPVLLSVHPAEEVRLAALRATIVRQPRDDVYPINFDWELARSGL